MTVYRTIFFLLSFFLSLSFHSSGQVVEKGNVSIEAYIGAPDLYKILFRSSLGSSVYNINTRAQGPFGARLDYMLTRRTGIGADIWYVNTNITGVYNPNHTPTPSTNIYFSAKLMRINIVPRVTIHLSKSEKFDPYVHFGIGYLISRFTFNSSNTTVYNEDNPLPKVAFRAGMGLKYYFTPELGAVLDVGLGGPLISIGFFKCWRKDEKSY